MDRLFNSLDSLPDRDAILERVDYYNKLCEIRRVTGSRSLEDLPNRGSNYNRDFFEYARFFPSTLYVDTGFGDNTAIMPTPSIVKSRPIHGENSNDVVLNLDKVRHFVFLKDKLAFTDKKDIAIFRGAMKQPHRQRFMHRYFGHPLVDCGDTQKPDSKLGSEILSWQKPLITLYDHLKYKFVICLEGHDVASNLKWVMSSNSLAVMPKPKYETWFMEGKLKPNVHYVEIKDDYSDLEEKLRYYSAHPEEAEVILKNAHAFVSQFQDQEREDLISLLVLKKYFEMTGQTP